MSDSKAENAADGRFDNVVVFETGPTGPLSTDEAILRLQRWSRQIVGMICFIDHHVGRRTIFCPDGELHNGWISVIHNTISNHVSRHQENSDFGLTVWRGTELPERDDLLNNNFSSTGWGVDWRGLTRLALLKEIGALLAGSDREELVGLSDRWLEIVNKSIFTDLEAFWAGPLMPLGLNWKRKENGQ